MQTITRDELKRRMDRDEDLDIVEVLGAEQYNEFHLPGAINVPVSNGSFEERITDAIPDKSKPVVVYCLDEDCDASPRAARRMEDLGYEHVFDYEAGKADWKQWGLPIES